MDDFAKKALGAHNKCRELHQVPPLSWSSKLAKEAQAWVNKIAKMQTLKHASKEERNSAGENIAMFSDRFDVAAEEATKMWYSEVEKFNWRNPSFQSGTGHFTQVVWKDSKELGMARAKAPDGRSTYVVARYGPAGNMMGNFDKNVFPSKSKDPNQPFPKSTQSYDSGQKARMQVEHSGGTSGGTQTRTVVKEIRTQTPQGVRTVKTTITSTTGSHSPSSNRKVVETNEPTHRFGSLNISGGAGKAKPTAKPAEPVFAGRSSSPVPCSGTFKEQSLKLHNHYRRQHKVSDVSWSNELARGAQAWADKIARANTLKHDSACNDGENIAYFGGSRDNIAKEAVDMWYNEVKKYQFGRSGFKSGTGHFTQVVWKATKEIGMAMAQSSDGRNTYVVARYRPAGNMMGDFEANVFPPRK